MSPQEAGMRIIMALTNYDRKQSTKRGYNPYALAHYCKAATDIEADLVSGVDMRKSITTRLHRPLVDHALKAVGLPKSTDDENRM
jgi:hypothetical protein